MLLMQVADSRLCYLVHQAKISSNTARSVGFTLWINKKVTRHVSGWMGYEHACDCVTGNALVTHIPGITGATPFAVVFVTPPITTTGKIDEYISAEIPNKDKDPELYQFVTNHMMHGLCGADNPSCPCTIKYKCTKKFPRQFNETTVIDDSGYALYKRSNDGNIIKKSRTDLHNVLCRSLCDARSMIISLHPFVVDKSSVNETKFESWMELNQTDPFVRLVYVDEY
ncbi:hypothetical protein Tco_0977102 [Tanacetum coccineum]|uniref:Uncharacterized protein n=1 Tax=Tanacetum coccineum TaxID=301880 RepID=A0ABQ5EJ49_9ASTR